MFDGLISNNEENKKIALPPDTPLTKKIFFYFLESINAELLGVRESEARLPTVIGKHQKNRPFYPGNVGNPASGKRKFDDFATAVGNPAEITGGTRVTHQMADRTGDDER